MGYQLEGVDKEKDKLNGSYTIYLGKEKMVVFEESGFGHGAKPSDDYLVLTISEASGLAQTLEYNGEIDLRHNIGWVKVYMFKLKKGATRLQRRKIMGSPLEDNDKVVVEKRVIKVFWRRG